MNNLNSEWRNLAPGLIRQRVVIECTTSKVVGMEEIKDYLVKLSDVLAMRPLSAPFAYPAEDMGYGGWIHWITSGAHVYSYTTNPPLLTIDAYTCKPFSVEKAVQFTQKYFDVQEIVWKEIDV